MTYKKNLKKILTTFQKFLVYSLVFHGVLSLIVVLMPYFKKQPPAPAIEVVLIEPTNSSDVAVPTKTSQPKNIQQIVQTDENQANNELNQNAKYLSAKNNTVKKETVAKNIGLFKNTIAKTSAVKDIEQKEVVREISKQLAHQKTESKSKLFDTGFDAYSALSKNVDIQKKAQKERSFQDPSAHQDAASTNDHLENTEPSLMTQLNTREYKYYGYHKRIRTQLDQWYETKLRDQMKKIISQGRSIASEENKRTQLLIILNDKGNLVGIQVVGVSGVKELDDAAVEAFRQAAPFPNPPKGMIDGDGTIKVRWDFVLS